MLITDKPTEVYILLYKALRRIIINRNYDKAFTDSEDVKSKAYFSTLEGLDALLIPLVNLPANLFWHPLKKEFPYLFNNITDDITFILKCNPTNSDTPPPNHGCPYFQTKMRADNLVPYWTSECASFTLSVLINYYHLIEKFNLKIDDKATEKIFKTIDSNLTWIKLCQRDIGWSWTHDSPIHYWPTWSLLDTFEELLYCDFLSQYHETIGSVCKKVVDETFSSFQSNVASSYANEWEEKVSESQPYDVQSALDLSRLMLAITLHGTERMIYPLAQKLFDWCKSSDFNKIEYRYFLNVRNDSIPDYSLIPCLLRTLIIMAKKLTPKRIQELDIQLGQDHKIVINRVYALLNKSLITQGKYSNLWGVKNGHLTYELYFTERSIESLSELLLFYKEDEIKIKPIEIKEKDNFDVEPTKPSIKKKSKNNSFTKKDLEGAPLIDDNKLSGQKDVNNKHIEISGTNNKNGTPNELLSKIVPPNLPILEECFRQVHENKGSELFSNTNIIFVLHFLRDLIPFINIYKSLGCESQNMYFLAKNYHYPQKDLIISYLEEQGSEVFNLKTFDEDKFSDLTKKMLNTCIENAQKHKKKVLIIEDGGYFVPLYHHSEFKSFIKTCLGAVEQTSKGHWRDEEIKNLSFPVISVAKSRVKSILEGKEVSETLQENIVFITKNYVKIPPEKCNILILGYGTIGKGLAKALANKNFRVYVYDKDPIRQLDASLEIYLQALENLDNIGHIDLIVGVSGSTSLNNSNHFWHLKHNVYLLSGSSERVEFNLELLNSLSESKNRDGIITEYKLKKEKKVINLICDGEPINFELSGGINDSIIDPVYSEMFLSSTELLQKPALKNILQDVPLSIEQKVIDIYKEYYRKPKQMPN